MQRISVVIPAYEMHGAGAAFLTESFERLAAQTFHDFEVVVSDNAETDVIKDVCDRYAGRLNIRRVQNTDPRRGMSSNLNNAIAHASGAIVKILFQDDFLYGDRALETISDNFDLDRDVWLATACVHTEDGTEFFNTHRPRWHARMHAGKNTIGSPSVVAFKRGSGFTFDTNLKWLMDCEWYVRMHAAYGEPKCIRDATVAIRTGDHQTTRRVDKKLDLFEKNYAENAKNAIGREPLSLPSVTLVAVSGIDPDGAQDAMILSMIGVTYGAAVLVSHRPPRQLDPRITFRQCLDTELSSTDPKNKDDYSRFMAYDLHKYIDTDFCLIVHNDAFVIHPESWLPEFLEYDYLGAPWPPGVHFSPDGTNIRVGNGGFSLRSKRMLTMLNELNLPFTDGGTGFYNEDGIICVYYRTELENAGMRFPSPELAARFAHEIDCPESSPNPFGFHNYKVTSRHAWIGKIMRRLKKLL